jgi:starch phosphorylase
MFNTAVLAARRSATVTVGDSGIHLASWMSARIADLLVAHVGEDWRERQLDERAFAALLTLSDEDVWHARGELRGYLFDFMRERARRRWARDHATGGRLVALGTLLDDRALTIGCVPRFSEGEHAGLLFEDLDRLARIVTAPRRPVQIVFAGSVDSADGRGRHQVERVIRQTLDPLFGGRLAFLEDYDLHVARLLTQGCDVWLTVPPAGGASLGAVKAAINGVPQLGGVTEADARWQYRDGRTLYALLEEEIVPAFYERTRGTVPERWVSIVRETLAQAVPRYSVRRRVMAAAGIQGQQG